MAAPTPTPTTRPVNINLGERERTPPKGPGLLIRTEKHKINGVEYNVPIYSDGYGGELPTDAQGRTIFPKNARGEIEFQTPTGPQGMPAGTPPQQPTLTAEPAQRTVTVPDPRTGRPMVYPPGHPQAGSPQLFKPDEAKDLTDILDKQRKWESESDPVKKATALAELEIARQKVLKSGIEIDYLPATLQATINRDVAATEQAGAQAARVRALLPGEVAAQTYDIAGKAQALDLGQVNIDRLRTLSRNEALTSPGGLEDSVLYLDDLHQSGLLSVADRDEMIAGVIKNAKVALRTGITDPAKRDEIERDWARIGVQVTAEERAGRAQTEVERRNAALEAQARQDAQRQAAERILMEETTRRGQAQTGFVGTLGQVEKLASGGPIGGGGTSPLMGFLGFLSAMGKTITDLSQIEGAPGAQTALAGIAQGAVPAPGPAPVPSPAGVAPDSPEQAIADLTAAARDPTPMSQEDFDAVMTSDNPFLEIATRHGPRPGLGAAAAGLGFLGNLTPGGGLGGVAPGIFGGGGMA